MKLAAVAALAATLFVGLCAARWGAPGAAGGAFGVLGAAFSVFGLWAATKLMANAAADRPSPLLTSAFLTVVFLAKMPVLFALFLAAQRSGEGARPAFLAGLGLVYSALLGWAITRRHPGAA